jgi:hypothetical protein
VALAVLDIGDEANTAGVMLVSGVVKPLSRRQDAINHFAHGISPQPVFCERPSQTLRSFFYSAITGPVPQSETPLGAMRRISKQLGGEAQLRACKESGRRPENTRSKSAGNSFFVGVGKRASSARPDTIF